MKEYEKIKEEMKIKYHSSSFEVPFIGQNNMSGFFIYPNHDKDSGEIEGEVLTIYVPVK